MTTILSTLDGSRESEAVLPVLEKLAAATHATVYLFTAVEPPAATPRAETHDFIPKVRLHSYPGATSSIVVEEATDPAWAEDKDQALARVQDEAAGFLLEAGHALKEKGIDIHIHAAIERDAAQAITTFANQRGVDIIAMATHGRTGLREVVQGSVAEAVVRSGVAPVLLVRSR